MRKQSTDRTLLLVVLLLVTCYFANWTDDNYSYSVATRWRAFQWANGAPKSVSGGSYNDSAMFLSSKQWNLSNQKNGRATKSASVMESVFGTPLGEPSASDGNDSDGGQMGLSASNSSNAAMRAARSGAFGRSGSGGFGMSGAEGFTGMSGMSLGSGGLGASPF